MASVAGHTMVARHPSRNASPYSNFFFSEHEGEKCPFWREKGQS